MDEITLTLARANIYGTMAMSFVYPEDSVIDDIKERTPDMSDWLKVIGADAETMEKGLAFATAGILTPPAEARRNYNELYTGRKQCSLDESEYDKAIFHRYQRMADISGFYNAFGFELSQESHQRPDFIGTELEFVKLLLLKRAYAIEQGWEDKAKICEDAETEFFREHIEWWIPTMCEKLREASKCAFYRSISNFLEPFIRHEASRYLQPA